MDDKMDIVKNDQHNRKTSDPDTREIKIMSLEMV